MTALLITGGTGTVGQSIVPIALSQNWKRIVIFSRDEYKQAMMEREFSIYSDTHKLRYFLGDVRDQLRLEMAMDGITHVIHAAALKRIEKCEADPIEAIRTNIDGTANVIHSAIRKGVSHVCAVSTDKAYRPISLYGSTKLTMERLVLAANNISGGKCSFSAVRLGNIFASRGSVVEIWDKILSTKCKTVPISSPEVTRYYITAHETAKYTLEKTLTSEAKLWCHEGMSAYSLSDLATAMGVENFNVVGLGPFEKLHEEMHGELSSLTAPRMSVEELKAALKLAKKGSTRIAPPRCQ